MKLEKNNILAFDIETFASCFTVGFMNWETSEYIDFEISEYRDDGKLLFDYLADLKKQNKMTISFNGMFFDVPVLHKFINLWINGVRSPIVIRNKIYEYSQWIINEAPRFFNTRNPYWIDIDLYKVNHYDNRAKATSLKKVEVFLRMESIEELPYDFSDPHLTEQQVSKVRDYMKHDVTATKLFADFCKDMIDFRFKLVDKFGTTAALNYSDSKIGAELMNKELIDKMGYDSLYKMVNNKREPVQTHYPDGFEVGPLLFPYIEFKTDAGKAIHEFFKNQTIKSAYGEEGTGAKGVFNHLDLSDVGDLSNYVKHDLTNTEIKKQRVRDFLNNTDNDFVFDKKGYPELPKGEDGKVHNDYKSMGTYIKKYWDHLHLTHSEYSEKYKKTVNGEVKYCSETFKTPTKLKHLNVIMGNVVVDLGIGGAHASIEAGIYEENDEYEIWDCDIVSMYPSLSIENFLSPKQYKTEVWVDTYGTMKRQRLSYDSGTPENKALKLALNSTYGNSSNKYSPIRDPAYTVSTCINGQLSILMLCERILEVPGAKIATINTDGILAFIPKKHRQLYFDKCSEFEKVSKLDLEYKQYHRLLQRDVNSFIYI